MGAVRSAVGMNMEDPRATTRNGNYFARFATTPCQGGADVVVTPRDGMVVVPEADVETGAVRIRIRREVGPKVGRAVRVGGRTIEVAERRYDQTGALTLRDALTGAWYPWR